VRERERERERETRNERERERRKATGRETVAYTNYSVHYLSDIGVDNNSHETAYSYELCERK